MSKKVFRFQIEKAQINPANLPETASKLRSLIQDVLFEWLRKVNDNCEKILNSNSHEVVDLRSKHQEVQKWKNPSDIEIRQLIENQGSADDPSRGGWSYSVNEEALYVNGILTIYVAGHKSIFPISKWMQFPDLPGFRVSEETIND